jgi:hypothetical protein
MGNIYSIFYPRKNPAIKAIINSTMDGKRVYWANKNVAIMTHKAIQSPMMMIGFKKA